MNKSKYELRQQTLCWNTN